MAGGVNLIPLQRIRARQRRRRVRWWALGCGAYGAVLLAVGAGSILLRDAAADGAAVRIAELDARIQASEASLAAVRLELAQRRAVLRVNEAVSDQPDWSILLALLAEKVGEGVALESCELTPQAAPAAADGKPSAAAPALYKLSVRGFGRDQGAVSAFVLGLEESRLFDHVKLLETKRTPLLAGEAVSFTVECELVESPEAAT